MDPLFERIASWSTIEIVGWARYRQEARMLAEELAADVVLMDVEAPEFQGAAAIRSVKVKPGRPILLVLTSEDTPSARTESFAAGADGFVTKTEAEEKLRALVATLRPDR